MLRIAAILGLCALAACSFGPAVTTNPLDVDDSGLGPGGRQVVSVCYRSSNTTREEIQALAEERCAIEGSSVELWKSNMLLNECPVLLKRRVSFVCVPPADENAKVRQVAPLRESIPALPGAEVPGTTVRPLAPQIIEPPETRTPESSY